MPGQIRTEVADHIGWMIVDQVDRRNAITLDMWRSIPKTIDALVDADGVRVIVIRGAGETFFVSGADISEFEQTRFGDAAHEYQAANDAAFSAIESASVPTIAMIHGACLGGGLALALSADLRYCDPFARFTIPAARLGIGYPAGGVAQLQRIVGPAVAKEILYTAEIVDAERALRWGLVNAVIATDELADHVVQVANQIAANAPLSQRAAKLAVDGAPQVDIESAVRHCAESDDYREGVRAFLEKRPPQFRGI